MQPSYQELRDVSLSSLNNSNFSVNSIQFYSNIHSSFTIPKSLKTYLILTHYEKYNSLPWCWDQSIFVEVRYQLYCRGISCAIQADERPEH